MKDQNFCKIINQQQDNDNMKIIEEKDEVLTNNYDALHICEHTNIQDSQNQSRAASKRSDSKLSSSEIRKLLRDNIANVYSSESNKNIQIAKDLISSSSKPQSVNTSKRTLQSARQRSVRERPKTSKVSINSPKTLLHTNKISRNVFSPHKRPTFLRTARIGETIINDYDILASSKANIKMDKRVKKRKIEGNYAKRPETYYYSSSINTLRDKMKSTPIASNYRATLSPTSPGKFTSFSRETFGSKVVPEKTIVNISDFQEGDIDKYDVDALYYKINAHIKKEYSTMLIDEVKQDINLSSSLAVVPKEDSKSWKLIRNEIQRLTQKPEVSRAIREEIEESKLVAKK